MAANEEADELRLLDASGRDMVVVTNELRLVALRVVQVRDRLEVGRGRSLYDDCCGR